MDKLKFTLFSIVVLAVVGLLGYWAVSSIESGSEHTTKQKLEQLEQKNEDLKKEVETLTDELSVLRPKIEEPEEAAEEPAHTPTVYKNQSLINELQKLVDDNINMKLKSVGTRVGMVQKFLNLYNNTENKIDNDYGAGTVKLVIAFQKAEGLTADGEAGPGTFAKMIEWLKAN